MLFASFLHVTLVRDPGSSPGCGAPWPGVSIEVRFCPRDVELRDSWPGRCPRDIISLFEKYEKPGRVITNLVIVAVVGFIYFGEKWKPFDRRKEDAVGDEIQFEWIH